MKAGAPMLRGATLLAKFVRALDCPDERLSAYPSKPKRRIAVMII
jgi:hypothetical protein